MKAYLPLFVVLAAWLVCLSTTSAVSFNLISDIHLDPAYGTAAGFTCTDATSAALGTTGCDSPPALLDSLVADVSARNSAYTVFCGDFQRHQFSASGLTATDVFGAVAKQLASITTEWPGAAAPAASEPRVISAIGNNDVVPDYTFDFSTATGTEALQERVTLMQTEGIISAQEATAMGQCGYYARTLTAAKLTFISLHTLLWTYRIMPSIADTVSDPCGQFQFLSDTLAAAESAGNKVIILGHIPPTPNVYSIISKGAYSSEADDMYWKPAYVTQFNEIMSKYQSTIVVQLYGHSHRFSLGASSSMGVPYFILPAVSPIYANLPSYFVADFDQTWNLRGLWQRYLTAAGTWQDGVNVLGAMGMTQGFSSVATVASAATRAMTDDTIWTNLVTLQSGGVYSLGVFPNGACDSFCRAVTVAAMTSTSYSSQQALTSSYVSSVTPTTTAVPTPDPNLAGSIVTTVLILGCVVAVTTILVLVHCIPRCRSGEIKMKMPDIDWKAELLNSTPKKEKMRIREEKEMRRQQREEQRMRGLAGAEDDGAVRIDVEEGHEQGANGGDAHYRTRE